MKLFITNKDFFESSFDNNEENYNQNRKCKSTKEIHIFLWNQLKLQIDTENSIPLCLTSAYDNGDGIAIFDFVTKRGDIYYYQYSTTAS